MGRLAIIEEDGGGGGGNKPPAQESPPRSTSDKKMMSSSNDNTSVTSAAVASSPPPAASSASSPTKSAGAEVSTSRMKQGGVSDESGYYEGDDYRDDSIEIVYDRHQNHATRPVSGAIANTTTNNIVVASSSSSSPSAVSITPLAKNAPTEFNGKSCCCSFNYLISSHTRTNLLSSHVVLVCC